MRLETLKTGDIVPYKNNPRKNDGAVAAVVESIRQCSYIAPIIVDEDHVIIAGHTRYKALKAMGYEEIQCLICEGLTEEQKKKYRLYDNKTGELAKWDQKKLSAELCDVDVCCQEYGLPVTAGPDQETDGSVKRMKTGPCCGEVFEI